MTRFAEDTKVPITKTRDEIERTLARFGADRFAYFSESGKAIVLFEAQGRRIRFDLPLPEMGSIEKNGREHRRCWRALLLSIKAKLSSVESKIETFEEAFLAHVVMPDGQTVGQHTRARIAHVYQGGEMQALLPAPRQGGAES
jgi:hypothetical protein